MGIGPYFNPNSLDYLEMRKYGLIAALKEFPDGSDSREALEKDLIWVREKIRSIKYPSTKIQPKETENEKAKDVKRTKTKSKKAKIIDLTEITDGHYVFNNSKPTSGSPD